MMHLFSGFACHWVTSTLLSWETVVYLDGIMSHQVADRSHVAWDAGGRGSIPNRIRPKM